MASVPNALPRLYAMMTSMTSSKVGGRRGSTKASHWCMVDRACRAANSIGRPPNSDDACCLRRSAISVGVRTKRIFWGSSFRMQESYMSSFVDHKFNARTLVCSYSSTFGPQCGGQEGVDLRQPMIPTDTVCPDLNMKCRSILPRPPRHNPCLQDNFHLQLLPQISFF